MVKKLLLTSFGIAAMWHADAQIVPYTRTINASGGSKIINGDHHEWSVGEMVLVNTYINTNIIVTQGLLQLGDVGGGINTLNKTAGNMQVYPNPAQDVVHLAYKLQQAGVLLYELQDINGKKIHSRQFTATSGESTADIPLQAIANGTYMLNVVFKPENGTQETVSFKVDKIEQ